MPLDWCEYRGCCRAAGIDIHQFACHPKPQLAQRMIERIWQAQIPICWVVADTVYGGNLDLRTWLEVHGYPYVMAVARPRTGRIPDTDRTETRRGCIGRSVRPSRWGLAAPVNER